MCGERCGGVEGVRCVGGEGWMWMVMCYVYIVYCGCVGVCSCVVCVFVCVVSGCVCVVCVFVCCVCCVWVLCVCSCVVCVVFVCSVFVCSVCVCSVCVCVCVCICVCVCVCTTDKMAIHLQCLACAMLQGVYSGGFLVSMCAAVRTSVTTNGAEWAGLGGAVVSAPRTLPLLLELPRGGGTEQGWSCM